MSCNGCRVLRKGCSEACVLRPCLQWIESAEAQGYATVFVAKFFGRAGLMSFISAVPERQRPALFQSLLFEAAGRTINPVNGAVGLLWTDNWQLCQAAVDTVLRGGTLRPLPEFDGIGGGAAGGMTDEEAGNGKLYATKRTGGWSTFSTAKRVRKVVPLAAAAPSCDLGLCLSPRSPAAEERRRPATPSMNSEESVTTSGGSGSGGREPRLLNLFV